MIWFGQGVKPTRLYVGAKGVLQRPGGQTPETLASGPGPDAEAHGVWGRRQGLWRLVLEVREGLFLAGKTDFVEALSPSFDPRAQHINIGAGLVPGTHQDTPSRVPATLSL